MPKGRPIRSVTIVGGGTAGWLTAAMMNHRLQWGFAHPEGVRITLIESPDTPTIGVGESTLPAIKQTLELLEISEAEFVTRTNATFKMGVRFENWHRSDGAKRQRYHHPLTGGVQLAGHNPAASLLKYGVPADAGLEPELANIVGHAIAAIDAGLSPRHPQAREYDGTLGYSYHVDAGLLADFLREVATARGVEHVRDHVVGVERTERGHVGALQLRQGGRHEVELIIDCSGFKGLIINEALAEPFVSYQDYLPNDRATALQVAHTPGEPMLPATVARAMNAGWRWRIPLQTRLGLGYVHASAFVSEQEAIDELTASVEHGAEHLMTPRTLKMRVGRTRRSWVGNCVAIGLADGFIEPLESTAIHFIDLSCRRLLQCFPSTDFEEVLANKYNTHMAALYDEVRDFLSMHFTMGDREDTPYWRAMRHEVKRSDRLEECLAIWRHALPDVYDPWSAEVFNYWSVLDILMGKGFYAEAPPAGGADLMPPEVWRAYLEEVRTVRGRLLGPLPPMEVMCEILKSQARIGESAARAPAVHTRPQPGPTLGPTGPVMGAVSQMRPPSQAPAQAGGMRFPMVSAGRGQL